MNIIDNTCKVIKFNDLIYGDVFKLPNQYIYYLRVAPIVDSAGVSWNCIGLRSFGHYHIMDDQDVIKLDANLVIE